MKKALLLSAVLLLTFFQTSLFANPIKNSDFVADSVVRLPPSWAFGVLYGGYTNQNQTLQRIDQIVERDYPIDAYWIDSWFWSFGNRGAGPMKYIDFVADTVEFPNRKLMWSYMENKNIKGGFWVWDCIFETGNEKVFNEFDSYGFFKNKYIETNPWHNYSTTTAMFQSEGSKKGTLCGNIDFKNPDAVALFKKKMKPFFEEGADFLKLDRTNAIDVCKAMFEITQESGLETAGRGFILSHAGGMQSDEYKRYPAKWTSDTRTDWTVKTPNVEFNSWVPPVAFEENISMFIDSNLIYSKIPFLTNDLGGFDMGKTNTIDEELYIRWLQFSIFSPIVEVFSQPENPSSNLAFAISSRADSLFRKYSHLRMELFPYIYSYAHKVRLEGAQMMKSLGDSNLNYLFGDEILVAPVYEQSARRKKIKLPKGNWVNFWTSVIVPGGFDYEASAPLETIPVFIRQGSILPMRKYASSIEKGSNDTLFLHLYPGADSNFDLIEDDGSSNDYLRGEFAKTSLKMRTQNKGFIFTIEDVLGDFRGMKSNRTIQFVIHSNESIQSAELNGSILHFYPKSKNSYQSEFLQTSKHTSYNLKISYN